MNKVFVRIALGSFLCLFVVALLNNEDVLMRSLALPAGTLAVWVLRREIVYALFYPRECFSLVWKTLRKFHQRAESQRHCALCYGPVRYMVGSRSKAWAKEHFKAVSRAMCMDDKCQLCDGEVAYQFELAGAEVRICRAHHFNPELAQDAERVRTLLRNTNAQTDRVYRIFDESVDRVNESPLTLHVCKDHSVLPWIGNKHQETLALLKSKEVVWDAVIPVYNDSALFR